MGAGASSVIGGGKEMDKKIRRISVSAQDNIMTKPMDGSDLITLEEAVAEVVKLRKFAYDTFETFKKRGSVFETTKTLYHNSGAHFLNADNEDHGGRREAVLGTQDKGIKSIDEYVKKDVEKDDIVRDVLLTAVKSNVLFGKCGEDEISHMVDAFSKVEVSNGDTIITQGDEGHQFYITEMGSFEVHVKAVGEKKSTKIEGIVLNDGEGFGELALMYSKPRAATIIAAEDSIVWSLEREDYHNITTYFHMKRLKENIDMLGTVEIVPGKRLKDVCTPHELDHMAMCLEKDAFKEGDVIMRQATPGETLFIVQSGKVGCYKSSAVKNMRSSMKMLYEMGSQVGMEVGIEGYAHNTVDIRTTVASEESLVARFGEFQKCMGVGDFFGERGLLEEDVREVSCVAQEDCVLLTLDRDVIEDTIGKMSDIIKGTHNLDEVDDVNFEKEKDLAEKLVVNLTIDDLELITVLGAGAFGKVVLAKHKQTQRCFALKCQAKEMIIQQRLQEHVMHEIHIMSQFCHPNIGMIHTVVQDTRYLYFVLELLQGGELFTHAKKYYKLDESWSKFYSASVVLAYSQIHAHKVAYRDLKPENIVMDRNGYAKIVDFGLAKVLKEGKTWTVCGTPDYLAPEIITTEGHDYAVDYWALGVLIFELTSGQPPFMADDPMEVYEKILNGVIIMPNHFSKSISDIVKKLLIVSQTKRLGNTKGGIHSIMTHKWFSGFDWEGLLEQTLPAKDIPIKSNLKNPEDAHMFEPWDPSMDLDSAKECKNWVPKLPDMYTQQVERQRTLSAVKEGEQRPSTKAK